MAADDVSLLKSVPPSGIGREKMPREKKLLVGSLLAGSLGIVLAMVLDLILTVKIYMTLLLKI